MYAIIREGNQQFKVIEGEEIWVQRRPGQPGDKVEFSDVLLVADGESVRIGAPQVAGAKVTGEIVGDKRSDKVITIKYRKRESWRRKKNHRQTYSAVKIEKILPGT